MGIFTQTRFSKIAGFLLVAVLATVVAGSFASAATIFDHGTVKPAKVNGTSVPQAKVGVATGFNAPVSTPKPQVTPTPNPTQVGPVFDMISEVGCLSVVSPLTANLTTNTASVTVRSSCDAPIDLSLSSYKVFVTPGTGTQWLSTQVFFNGTNVVKVPSNGTQTFAVNIPTCAGQIDFWFGEHPRTLVDSNPYIFPTNKPSVLSYTFTRLNQLCGTPTPTPTSTPTPTPTSTPTPTPTMNLVCSPTTQAAAVNQKVTLSATGGNGSYAWTAVGAATASVSANTATVSYATIGTKVITVASAGLTATCQVLVSTATVTPTPTPTTSLTLSKKAWNDTKNVDATTKPASKEDYITYTLTVKNNTATDAQGYVFTDSLAKVLPLADMVDMGGGTVANQTITYPAVTIPANGSVSKTFKVRIKYFLSPNISYQMTNVFGNTITVVINPPPAYVPPVTGGATTAATAIGFGSLLTAGFVLHRKKNLAKLIFS